VQDLAKRLELTEVRFLRFNRKEQGKGQRLTEIIMRAIPGFLEPREGESLVAARVLPLAQRLVKQK
jgi:hypothetical protein